MIKYNLLNSNKVNKILILFTLFILTLWLYFSFGYIEDDAFIHLEFAKNIAENNSFSFKNINVNGDSSPLWIIFISILLKFKFSYIVAIKILSYISVIFATIGIYKLADLILKNKTCASFYCIYIVTSPFFIHWSYSGMEAVFALGILCWVLVLSNNKSVNPTIFLLAGLLPLIRFELLPVSIFMIYVAYTKFNTQKISLLVSIVLIGFPFILWGCWAYHEFGSVIPTTNSAKKLYTNFSYFEIIFRQFSLIIAGYGSVILLFSGTLLFYIYKHLRKLIIFIKSNDINSILHLANDNNVLLFTFIYPVSCLGFYIVDRITVQTRYILIFLPLLVLGLAALVKHLKGNKLITYYFVVGLIFNLLIFVNTVYPHVMNKITLVRNIEKFIVEIKYNVKPDIPISVYSIGQISLYLPNPIVDIGGIIFPEVIPFIGDRVKTDKWAWDKGARCFISAEMPPIESFELVQSYLNPVIGWHLNKKFYDQEIGKTGIFCTKQSLLEK